MSLTRSRNCSDAVNEVRHRPLVVKLPPYPASDVADNEFVKSRDSLMALVQVCKAQGVDGLTVANTRPTPDSRLAVGSGGLSGRPVLSRMIEMVRDVRSEVGDGMTINACGGVFTGEDALAAILAGRRQCRPTRGSSIAGRRPPAKSTRNCSLPFHGRVFEWRRNQLLHR